MTLSLLLLLACSDAPGPKDTSEPPIQSPSGPAYTTTNTDEPQSLTPGISTWTYSQTIDGVDIARSVYLHVPPELSDEEPTPVVFSFHGNGGRATPFLASLESYVLDGRFIGVYAQGHENAWNTGQADLTADDVAFIQAILADLSAYPSADMDRVYAQGFSNGAGMSHLVALRSLGFKAIAPQATALHVDDLPTADTEPVAVIQFMGIDDPLCPYYGGVGAGGLDFLSAEESAATWAAHNGCDPKPTEDLTIEGNLRIAYTGCPDGAAVVHYRLMDCGLDGPPAPCMHGWPNDMEGGLQDLVLEFFANQN